ncbi:MAG: cysteine--tRNA ligase [Methanobacteriota archaeon]|nr:MAG: cysteine--tRNA ligase [Euryarchaeota archaeon]
MALKLYNTLTRRKEVFRPLKKGEVLYYTCGPTVHDYAHIGNFRTFVVQDVLKRWLQSKGYRVRHVMNITDVDEKTLERAARKKIPLEELTSRYEKAFFEDLDCLNIKRADRYPRVSDNIPVIAGMVEGLLGRGHAFRDSDGSIYYDINTCPDYGKLSGNRPKRRIRAKMPREDYQRPKNFLLWKRCEGGGEMGCWDSRLGSGRPGWHIECAALANRYLGETIDIHSGGVDLIFPHHENEIAEAEGFSGKPFSRFWVHVEHLIVYGRKMSKSAGNFFTLRQIIRRGYDPRAMRLLYLKTHYRERLDFDFERLEEAGSEIGFLLELARRLEGIKGPAGSGLSEEIEAFKRDFTAAMDDDLHTDLAWKTYLALLHKADEAMESGGLSKEGAGRLRSAMEWVDSIFGLMGEC